ncbi:MAG: NUDIX domain-containing protein [Gaiellaceae bacterium]
MRRPEEVFVVVHRPGVDGPEFLVLERSPERQGYWHVVAGALEEGEQADVAAGRELLEETGLGSDIAPLGRTYVYSLADEPPEVRARFEPEVEVIVVTAFAAQSPPGWEPALDDEHVGYRWCSAEEAVALLRYPEPQDAVRAAARSLAGARS